MNETRDLLERIGERFPFPDQAFERLERRRERKRRNQRIAAGAVGIAVFAAAVWIVMTGGPFDRTQTPITPGGAATGPTVTGPTIPADVGQVGLAGLPPEGAEPSFPRKGELVLHLGFGHTSGDRGRFELSVYADGRLIWQQWGDPSGGGASTGLIEQRLTAEGVELVRSEALSTGLFDQDLHFKSADGLYYGQVEILDGERLVSISWGDIWGGGPPDGVATRTPTPEQVSALQRLDARLEDLASWLPASAWEDQEARPFVPSTYQVCYGGRDAQMERPRILDLLPEPALDLLGARNMTQGKVRGPYGSITYWCSDLTTEETRVFVEALDEAGGEQNDPPFLSYRFAPDGSENAIDIRFEPNLPHWT